ncbi:MAG: putative quinol monooxygenase [Aurantibacter sp.]
MTVILVRVGVRKRNRNEFLKIMQEASKKIKKEYGCERFEVHRDFENDTIFSFYGIWKTPGDFKRYLKSDQFAMAILALKLSRKNPEIYYFKDKLTVGLAGLLQLRETLKI